MFKCDEFIYLQLQKTASNHIVALLQQLFEGQTIGRHNCASLEQLKTTPYFIASIRNPWDWYVSLWAFGVGGRGSLRHYLTEKNYADLARAVYSNPKHSYQHCASWLKKDPKKWRAVYQRSDDVAAFRQWLLQLQHPKNDLPDGYSRSGINGWVGFMSYRYLCLCCHFKHWSKQLKLPLNDLEALQRFDRQYCYIDYFIRQENLAATVIDAVERIRPLSATEKSLIQNHTKTNTSRRPFALADYYDQQAIDLVAARERLLIEKFNYLPPT